MVNKEFILETLKIIFTWPTVLLIVLIIFFKEIKKVLGLLINKQATLKAGNFEFGLKDLKSQHSQNHQEEVTKDVLTITSPQKKSKIKELKLLGIKHELKVVSFQLKAWLFMHKNGKPFSPGHLLKINHIPIKFKNTFAGNYCVHSMYEKEAIAAEFKSAYWNFKRFDLIRDVDKKNVKINQDSSILQILDEAMEYLVNVELERTKILVFTQKYLLKTSKAP